MIYYGDNDPFVCAWLRELIRCGHLSEGTVDERDIKEVQAKDLQGCRQVHLFAGIGGWLLALQLAGWDPARPVWTASCPCQPFSAAGKGLGEDDSRHLWPVLLRLVRQCRPATLFGEQVASRPGYRWFSGVRADLEKEGYAVGCADLPACCAGAPHIRQRLFWVAVAQQQRRQGRPVPRGASPTRQADRGRVAGGVEHPASNGRGEVLGPVDCQARGRPTTGTPDGTGATGGLGHAKRPADQHQPGGLPAPQGEGAGRSDDGPGCAGDAGGLGDTGGDRAQEGQATLTEQPRAEAWPARPPVLPGAGGFWGAFDLVHCTDGKARRVEPGTFPLAHGVPGRVGMLRGYGNAIVPETAAIFVRAFLEAERDLMPAGTVPAGEPTPEAMAP